ncbi:hypothetical protein [Streptomyces sp. NPDC048385]|uniref:hypothetical protein n=1 Tax=unclassified Streptomyces TaxID=2593676 RepID=UPI0034207EAB
MNGLNGADAEDEHQRFARCLHELTVVRDKNEADLVTRILRDPDTTMAQSVIVRHLDRHAEVAGREHLPSQDASPGGECRDRALGGVPCRERGGEAEGKGPQPWEVRPAGPFVIRRCQAMRAAGSERWCQTGRAAAGAFCASWTNKLAAPVLGPMDRALDALRHRTS